MTSPPPAWDTTAAWHELLAGLGDLDQTFLSGPRAVRGERAAVEGYRALATTLGVALDAYLFADPARPAFVDVNTPFRRDRRWGGDNTDAWYAFTPIDPARTYRVRGRRGDSAYFSLTVYNEPSPGEWSNRIVAIVNDTDLAVGEDGAFELVMGPAQPPGYEGTFVALDPDAAVAFTRDYQVDPRAGRRVMWEIEALDDPPPLARTDAGTAGALRAALAWSRMLFQIVPLATAEPDPATTLGHNAPGAANAFAEPYQVGDANFGWSARDACYAFAAYALAADEALVVTHRPPRCRFWNMVAWNPFMATEAVTDARTSVNHGSAVPNADGTVTVVVAQDRLAHPNAISTCGHDRGTLALRWFLADAVPARPEAAVVPAAAAPVSPG
jgi:Protein of unknown function (DUF1214)